MQDEGKAKEQLCAELYDLRQRVAELESLEIERKHVEEALRESEERYRAIIEDQTELICRFLPGGIITFVNTAYCRYFNKRLDELIGHSFMPLIPEEDREKPSKLVASLTPENPVGTHEHRVIKPNGEIGWQQWTNRAIFDDRGDLIEFQAVGRDITDLKQAEEQLKAALQEKELLMKEILHRTKNNMGAIVNLLNLQSNRIKEARILHILEDIKHRVEALLLVQQKLYQSQDITRINLREYLHDLAYMIFGNLRVRSNKVTLRFDLESLIVSPDTAIPCGLLLNELLTNALKYAFPGDKNGEIHVDLCKTDTGDIELGVRDTGVGMPEDIDLSTTNSLGLKLTTLFTRQLQGSIELKCDQGTEWLIRFQDAYTKNSS